MQGYSFYGLDPLPAKDPRLDQPHREALERKPFQSAAERLNKPRPGKG